MLYDNHSAIQKHPRGLDFCLIVGQDKNVEAVRVRRIAVIAEPVSSSVVEALGCKSQTRPLVRLINK